MKTFAQWAEEHGLSESECGVGEAAWQAALAHQPMGEPAAFVEHFTDRLSALNLTHAGLELGVGKHTLYAGRPAQAADLAVWCGPMPESNGRQNWTAVLYRKANGIFGDGHMCIERSEYPDRVRYEADRLRYLIGEREDEPDILKYDEKLHSGYGDNDGGEKTRSLTFLEPTGAVWAHLERVYPLFGPPESGWVVNGGWYWRRIGDVEYAYCNERDTEPVNQWPARDWTVANDAIKIVERDEDDDIPF